MKNMLITFMLWFIWDTIVEARFNLRLLGPSGTGSKELGISSPDSSIDDTREKIFSFTDILNKLSDSRIIQSKPKSFCVKSSTVGQSQTKAEESTSKPVLHEMTLRTPEILLCSTTRSKIEAITELQRIEENTDHILAMNTTCCVTTELKEKEVAQKEINVPKSRVPCSTLSNPRFSLGTIKNSGEVETSTSVCSSDPLGNFDDSSTNSNIISGKKVSRPQGSTGSSDIDTTIKGVSGNIADYITSSVPIYQVSTNKGVKHDLSLKNMNILRPMNTFSTQSDSFAEKESNDTGLNMNALKLPLMRNTSKANENLSSLFKNYFKYRMSQLQQRDKPCKQTHLNSLRMVNKKLSETVDDDGLIHIGGKLNIALDLEGPGDKGKESMTKSRGGRPTGGQGGSPLSRTVGQLTLPVRVGEGFAWVNLPVALPCLVSLDPASFPQNGVPSNFPSKLLTTSIPSTTSLYRCPANDTSFSKRLS